MNYLKLALLLCVVVFFSCEKDDSDEKKLDENNIYDEAISNLEIDHSVNFEDEATDVGIFFRPVVKFDRPIEQELLYVIPSAKPEHERDDVMYRVVLDTIYLSDNDGNIVVADYVFDNTKTEIQLCPKFNLPQEKKVFLTYTYHLERIKYGNVWEKVDENLNTIVYSFRTAVAPKYFQSEHVEYSYPIHQQANFYQDEYKQGYIMFKPECNLDYIFESENDVPFFGTLTSTNGETRRIELAYKDKEIIFDMPVLENETGYKLRFNGLDQSGTDTLLLHEIVFRTSKFNNFKDKMQSLIKTHSWSTCNRLVFEYSNSVKSIQMFTDNHEGELFDSFEMYRGKSIPTLIQFKPDTTDNWYVYVNNLLYKSFENVYHGIKLRDTSVYGFPPTKPIHLTTSENRDVDVYCTFNNQLKWPPSVWVSYGLPDIVYIDLEVIQFKYSHTSQMVTEKMQRVIDSKRPYLSDGMNIIGENFVLHVFMQYVLPGKNIVTSQVRELVYDRNGK